MDPASELIRAAAQVIMHASVLARSCATSETSPQEAHGSFSRGSQRLLTSSPLERITAQWSSASRTKETRRRLRGASSFATSSRRWGLLFSQHQSTVRTCTPLSTDSSVGGRFKHFAHLSCSGCTGKRCFAKTFMNGWRMLL